MSSHFASKDTDISKNISSVEVIDRNFLQDIAENVFVEVVSNIVKCQYTTKDYLFKHKETKVVPIVLCTDKNMMERYLLTEEVMSLCKATEGDTGVFLDVEYEYIKSYVGFSEEVEVGVGVGVGVGGEETNELESKKTTLDPIYHIYFVKIDLNRNTAKCMGGLSASEFENASMYKPTKRGEYWRIHTKKLNLFNTESMSCHSRYIKKYQGKLKMAHIAISSSNNVVKKIQGPNVKDIYMTPAMDNEVAIEEIIELIQRRYDILDYVYTRIVTAKMAVKANNVKMDIDYVDLRKNIEYQLYQNEENEARRAEIDRRSFWLFFRLFVMELARKDEKIVKWYVESEVEFLRRYMEMYCPDERDILEILTREELIGENGFLEVRREEDQNNIDKAVQLFKKTFQYRSVPKRWFKVGFKNCTIPLLPTFSCVMEYGYMYMCYTHISTHVLPEILGNRLKGFIKDTAITSKIDDQKNIMHPYMGLVMKKRDILKTLGENISDIEKEEMKKKRRRNMHAIDNLPTIDELWNHRLLPPCMTVLMLKLHSRTDHLVYMDRLELSGFFIDIGYSSEEISRYFMNVMKYRMTEGQLNSDFGQIGQRAQPPKYGSSYYTRTCKSYQSSDYFNSRNKSGSKVPDKCTGCPFYSNFYAMHMDKQITMTDVMGQLGSVIKDTVTPKAYIGGTNADADYSVVSVKDIEDIVTTASKYEPSVACFMTFTKRHGQLMNKKTNIKTSSSVHHAVTYTVDLIKTFNDSLKAMADTMDTTN